MFNSCFQGPCVLLEFFETSRIIFLFFFVWILQTVFPLKPMFSKGPSVFVLLFVIMGIYFAPARGSSASVGDHIMTSKVYIKVEHVGTCFFFVWNLQTVFPLKPIVSEGPFLYFFCNDGPLSFRPHVVALLGRDQPKLYKSWTSHDLTS